MNKGLASYAPLNDTNRNWERALIKAIKSGGSSDSSKDAEVLQKLGISSFDELTNIEDSDILYYTENGRVYQFFTVDATQFSNSTKSTSTDYLLYEFPDPEVPGSTIPMKYTIYKMENGYYIATYASMHLQ